MATVVIQKRKRKSHTSYMVSYRDPVSGRKRHYQTYWKSRLAQQAANDLRGLLDSGKIPETKPKKLVLMTFGEVGQSLRQEWSGRLKTRTLSQKTCYEYKNRLDILDRVFRERLVCEISREDVTSYVNRLAEEQSNVTANRSLSVIRKVFSHALAIRAILSNPTEGVKFLSEREHERNRFVLPHEIALLIEATRTLRSKHYLPALIYLGAEHGTSKQEALSLKWSDIDFNFRDLGLITFFRSKTRRRRTDYLMPRSREALVSWRDHQQWMRHRKKIAANVSNLVFCHLDGSPLKRFDKAWQAVCKLAGIEDFHYHDLRHTFCSNLILSGAGLKEAKDMIGHSDISMTDRYSHLTDRYKLVMQEQLARHYQNIAPTASPVDTKVR
jgi:site-specific recombinase XerD